LLGVPVPGLSLKLIPNGDKLEARYHGPNITPGFWRQPELSQTAFDDAGYFITGDALRFVDASDPNQGLLFDGRVAEDFKLTTGTWVSVGTLRSKVIETGAPWVQDAVITGHDRDEVGVIVFANWSACRTLANLSAQTPVASVLEHPVIQQALQDLLSELQRQSTGSANRITRGIIADFMPSIDLGEITDKGSLSQRMILKHRAELVNALYESNQKGQP
jgi:feruloyl-CoA synthase